MPDGVIPPKAGILRPLIRHLRRDPIGLLGVAILFSLILVAVGAPFLAPYPAGAQELDERFAFPNVLHPLGLDELGRDILSRLIFGARTSLFLSFVVVLSSSLIGILVGTAAGYLGGRIDELIMRIIDVLLAFPGILLAISLVAILGPGLANLVLALCLIGWVGYARLARAQILRAREMEFILSAKAAGARSGR